MWGLGRVWMAGWNVSSTYGVCPKFLAPCWVVEAHYLVFPLTTTTCVMTFPFQR